MYSLPRSVASLISSCLFAWLAAISSVAYSVQAPEDQGQGPALSPAESFAKFRVAPHSELSPVLHDPQISQPLSTVHDSFGRLWVVQYLQYPEPAGLKRISRDVFWRTVYDSVPLPPGHGGVPGADKITVHEDRDGDGTLETETTFVDGLNIVTSVVPTREGVWVLNPPYLLYYADLNLDLKADGPPEVHLEGFGLEDTHSVVNSLSMGPDGWLYAAQGSTVSGAVRRYGSAEPPLKSMGQAIWRYHPVLKQYEIFAEGGGNAFSVAFDARGQIFSGHNGGDTRGFHYQQEGYYRKGFNKHGSLSNPNTFGYLMPMKHDPIQRFTHAMLMTDGTLFDHRIPNSMLAVDPLHGKLIQTRLDPVGSTYETKDMEDTLASDDKWFRPVAINDGPDGAAYICDWYDFQVAHLYAHVGKMDREHGRIYRLAPARDELSALSQWDSQKANGSDRVSIEYLADRIRHPLRWQRWKARELIATHPLRDSLMGRAAEELSQNGERVLDWLWVAHACGWLEDTIPNANKSSLSIARLVKHPNVDIRCWAIRLACDDRNLNEDTANAICELVDRESEVRVLCQIAGSAKRLPASQALPIVSRLVSRQLPEDDLFLPLMLWWSVEPHAALLASERDRLPWKEMMSGPIGRHRIAPNLIEIWCKAATPQSYLAVAQTLAYIGQMEGSLRDDAAAHAANAFERAFNGRSLLGVPDAVIDALMQLGQPSLTLKLRRGDQAAKQEATKILQDNASSLENRVQIALLSGELMLQENMPHLIRLVKEKEVPERLRETAISALAHFESPHIGEEIIALWPTLSNPLRAVAGSALASRREWTLEWLNACETKRVEPKSLPLECIRSMRLHGVDSLQKRLTTLYPDVAGMNLIDAQKLVDKIQQRVSPLEADPYRGKAQFKALCARCHLLFAEGGEIGPDLTGYQRDQVSTLIRNIVAPSLEIREGYQSYGILLDDGTVMVGYLESQTEDRIVIKGTDGKSHSIHRSDIDKMTPQAMSIMPEGIFDTMQDQQIADLLSYLRSSQPLSD